MSANDIPGGILVTPEMLAAGLEELSEHHFGDDLGWILESVFRAMAYESPQIVIDRDVPTEVDRASVRAL